MIISIENIIISNLNRKSTNIILNAVVFSIFLIWITNHKIILYAINQLIISSSSSSSSVLSNYFDSVTTSYHITPFEGKSLTLGDKI